MTDEMPGFGEAGLNEGEAGLNEGEAGLNEGEAGLKSEVLGAAGINSVLGLESMHRQDWIFGRERAKAQIAGRERFLRSLRRQRSTIADDLVDPLAAMALFVESQLSCPATYVVHGLVEGLTAELRESESIDDEGVVQPDTLLHAWLSFLESFQVPEPRAAVAEMLGDDQSQLLLQGLAQVSKPTSVDGMRQTNKGNHESSSLNFDVWSTAASGQTVAQVLARLDALVGMSSVKRAMREIAAREAVATRRAAAGLSCQPTTRHMVFTGNPGTGKTTVARMVVDMLHASGAMPGAHLVEAARCDLVGEFLGSSALKTQKMADAAMGGVLFIDEAYALAGSGDEPADRFAREALDTLVKIMEDSRDSLVVILAGYPEDMQRLLDMNAGLRSRIGRVLTFEDLSDQDLLITFVEQVKQAGYLPGPQSLSPVKALLTRIERGRSFGNARWTRNLVDAAIDAHALRLVDQPDADRDTLETLTFADVASACWESAG